MNARADRFPLFDSLRAIAALSVLGFHVAFFQVLIHDSPLRPYLAHLDVGVTIFFLISGFLLYRPFVAARMRPGADPPHVPAYAWRRFLRITPAYWVALVAIALWLGLDEVWSHPVRFFGFGQIYDAKLSGGGIGQAWTLCVEVTFYALLPVWAFAMRRLGGRGRDADPRRVLRQELIALAALWLFSLGYKAWALTQVGPNELSNGPYLQPLPNFLDQFALGMALAVLTVHWEQAGVPRLVERLRERNWIPWLVAAVAFWVVSTRIGFTGALFQPTSRRMFLGRHELYSLVAVAVLIPAILATPGRGLVGRILANRVLLYLGLVSYGIYLYHFAVARQLYDWLGHTGGGGPELRWLTHGVLAILAATLLASLSYYVVERPALRLKRLVRTPGRVDPGEATSEPAPPEPEPSSRSSSASTATATSTSSTTSAGWRKRGTP